MAEHVLTHRNMHTSAADRVFDFKLVIVLKVKFLSLIMLRYLLFFMLMLYCIISSMLSKKILF